LSGPAQNEQDLLAHAEAIVKRHIKLLHAYNEIKDVGQGLMGLIADARGVRLKEVMEEMGIGEKD
jgi:DNA repair protein Swi5/Sae3